MIPVTCGEYINWLNTRQTSLDNSTFIRLPDFNHYSKWGYLNCVAIQNGRVILSVNSDISYQDIKAKDLERMLRTVKTRTTPLFYVNPKANIIPVTAYQVIDAQNIYLRNFSDDTIVPPVVHRPFPEYNRGYSSSAPDRTDQDGHWDCH